MLQAWFRRALVLTLLALMSDPEANLRGAESGDWPGWRGPGRTGVSEETGLLTSWPSPGPKLVWHAKGMGGGYSTPSVVDGRIYLLGVQGKVESVIAVDAENGRVLWRTPLGPVAEVGYEGSRSTPTVDGDRLYALSSGGDLACLELEKGKTRWTRSLPKDFGGEAGTWGYAESPLIDGNTLICTPGGAKATIVALNKSTGKPVWRSSIPQAGKAGYASPVIVKLGRNKEYVQFLARGLFGVDARTGRSLWSYERSANGTANIPTPIPFEEYVFSASGYGTGGGLVRLQAGRGGVTAQEVYFSRELVNHHGGFVRIGDHLYGTNERTLLCVAFQTGKIAWQNRSVGKGSIAAADGHLYVRGEQGTMALVEATPDAYREKGRFKQPHRSSEMAWPHPVIAQRRLYLRDQDVLLSFDVSRPGSSKD